MGGEGTGGEPGGSLVFLLCLLSAAPEAQWVLTVSQLLIVVGVTGFVFWHIVIVVVQTLCDSTDCNTPGSSVLHYVLEFAVH